MKSTGLFIVYHILGKKSSTVRRSSSKKSSSPIDFDSDDYEDSTRIGARFQAEIPEMLERPMSIDETPYKYEDRLVWDPHVLPEEKVVSHLDAVGVTKRRRRHQPSLYNEEVALFELLRCDYNEEEAKQRYMNRPSVNHVDIWSEEEKQLFFQELKKGRNFSEIQKVLFWKSTIELVDYYYMTKKP